MMEFLGNPTSIYRLTNHFSVHINQSQTLIETFWEATNGPNQRNHQGVEQTDIILDMWLPIHAGMKNNRF